MTIKEQKKELRKQILAQIRSLDPEYTQAADQAIISRLLSLEVYKQAKTVFCFVGTDHEINTTPFLQKVLDDRKQLAVPYCMKKGIMEAKKISSLTELEKSSYGILEPSPDTPSVPAEEIDLAIIPCVSCSSSGIRLGHGGGYYDKYFSEHPGIPAIMICRGQIMRDNIPSEAHDVLFPWVISEI